MNTIDITPVVNAVIALAATVVSVFLIPWIKSKTTAQQRSELVAWAKIGVAAAEQIYVGQGRGDEKKQYVLEFLKSKGFDLNEESVNELKPGEAVTGETLEELSDGKGDDDHE